MAGQILRIRKWRHYLDSKNWAEYQTAGPKAGAARRVTVVVVLGVEPIEPKPGEDLNVEDAMRELGWQRIPEDG